MLNGKSGEMGIRYKIRYCLSILEFEFKLYGHTQHDHYATQTSITVSSCIQSMAKPLVPSRAHRHR